MSQSLPRWGFPPWPIGLRWIVGLSVLELVMAALAGSGVTSMATPVAGIWPPAERFFGAVDTLARNPDLQRAGWVLPSLAAVIIAGLAPALAALLVAQRPDIVGSASANHPLTSGRTLASLYAQAGWHLAFRLATLVLLTWLLGEVAPVPVLVTCAFVVTVTGTLAHDATRVRVLADLPQHPFHPRVAWESYGPLLHAPRAALGNAALLSAQWLLAASILWLALHGLGDPVWRWAVRGLTLGSVTAGVWRIWRASTPTNDTAHVSNIVSAPRHV